MRKVGLFLFMFLLVSTISLPLNQMAYADLVIDNKVVLDSDQTIVEGIHVKNSGELIIATNTKITSSGNLVINNGVITIDGSLKFVGAVLINNGIINSRCGSVDPDSTFTSIGSGKFIDVDCADESNIKKFNNFQVSSGQIRTFNVTDKVQLTGDTKIFGTLVNKGNTENKGLITIFAGGTLNNIGALKNFCANISGRGISNFGVLSGSGSLINTVCSKPIAVNDSYSTNEDGVLTVNAPGVLSNDNDVDSPVLTASVVTGPRNGTLTLNNEGDFTYIPNADFFGSDSFVYKASDGDGLTATATVIINVASVNDPPIAYNDDLVVNEDDGIKDITSLVLNNDFDVDRDTLTVVDAETNIFAIGKVLVGPLTYNPNGQFERLSAGQTQTDKFDYTISDPSGAISTAIVTITINGQNDLPIAINDSYSTNEDGVLTVNAPGVLSNDNDVDSPVLTASVVTGPRNGTLTLNNEGDFTYIPNADFFGSDSFVYKASDGDGGEATATVSIQVLEIIIPDTEAPEIIAPIDVISEATAKDTPLSNVQLGNPIVTDAVDPFPTITNNAPNSFPIGSTVVTWTATDASGNSASATQIVNVVDTTKPTITSPSDISIETTKNEVLSTNVQLGNPIVTDAVDPFPTITNNAPNSFPIGSTVVTWTATDASGNSASATQIVNVVKVDLSLLEQKIKIITEIENMIDHATKDKTKKELGKSIKHLQKSTDLKLWDDDNVLNEKKGNKVFKEEEKAIKILLSIIKNDKESSSFIMQLGEHIVELSQIDEKLANNAYGIAINSEDPDEKHLNKAATELANADEDMSMMNYLKSIKHYGKAWKESIKAN